MRKHRNIINGLVGIGAVLLVASTALFAQDAITVDILEVCPGATNITLYPCDSYSTNGSAIATNYPVDSIEYMVENGTLTNVVKRLAKEGHICAVLGHRWESILHVTLEYRASGEYPQHRKCALCGNAILIELNPGYTDLIRDRVGRLAAKLTTIERGRN